MKHWNITVKGKVQKVSFRMTTKAVADQIGVKGFVLNRPDGSVYIEAEGDDFALESLFDFCSEGPEGAQVDNIDKEEQVDLKGFQNFVILKKPL